jgi:hypothetical protein
MDEMEVTYLPGRTLVRWATIAYMAYMVALGIMSLILLSRVRGLFGNAQNVSNL